MTYLWTLLNIPESAGIPCHSNSCSCQFRGAPSGLYVRIADND